MTKEDLKQWCKDWEDKKVSGDAYALFLNTYITTLESRVCSNCEFCLEDNNDTDVWLECRNPDSPMQYNSVITDITGYLTTDFCCNRWSPKDKETKW